MFRKIQILMLLMLFTSISLWSQTPTGINFQGIARDANGSPIANENMTVQISILDAQGNVDYIEDHMLVTDASGLFILVIGTGSTISGNYDGLEWSVSRDVSVGLDISSDGSFDIEFTTAFHSVPYAHYAKYAENVDDADADPSNELQQLSLENNMLSISDGNSVQLSQSSVIVGTQASDVPTSPTSGQLYFDETSNNFYVYHDEGWTEIDLGSTVSNIYATNSTDSDNDGIDDSEDNCPNQSNPDQSNLDGDESGDVCDVDVDGDGIVNGNDNCPEEFNPNQEDSNGNGLGDTCDESSSTGCDGLHPAFADFDTDNLSIYISGTNVVIESNGLPNHTSPYWSNTTERCLEDPRGNELCTNDNTTANHPLFVEPTSTSFEQMAPGNIDDFNGSYSLTVPQNPELASSSTSTGLGAIGIAVSGSMIYNDEEGPNVPLDNAVGSLDYTAAHTGPQSYHYHLETKAWSEDDDKLIGIMADGFFLYGRKCNSTGSYPTDLDASGGHTSSTQHCSEEGYHYHIQNDLYLNQYYILFPGDYQGTPKNIN